MGTGKVAVVAVLAGVAGCGGGVAAGRAADAAAGRSTRVAQVFIIAMENENIGQIYGNSSEAP